MEAIEFTAIPINGNIKLPEELSNINNEMKFIVLFDLNSSKSSIKDDSNFNAISLSTKGITFNREFANKR